MLAPESETRNALLVEVQGPIDLDELADAFVTFAEASFETRSVEYAAIDEAFSWSEVTAKQFNDVYANLASSTKNGPWLQAIWAEGVFCVLAQPGSLTKAEWEELQHSERLKLSPGPSANCSSAS